MEKKKREKKNNTNNTHSDRKSRARASLEARLFFYLFIFLHFIFFLSRFSCVWVFAEIENARYLIIFLYIHLLIWRIRRFDGFPIDRRTRAHIMHTTRWRAYTFAGALELPAAANSLRECIQAHAWTPPYSARHTNNVCYTNGHTLRAPSFRLYYSFSVLLFNFGQTEAQTCIATYKFKLYTFRSFLYLSILDVFFMRFECGFFLRPIRVITIWWGNKIKHAF